MTDPEAPSVAKSLRPIARFVGWFTKTTIRLVVVVAICTTLLVSGVMALSVGVFSFVTTVIETVTDAKTLRTRHAEEIAARDRQIAAQADEIALRDHRIAAQVDEIALRERRLLAQADEIAAFRAGDFVDFRGERVALREAVSEATDEISEIATRTMKRNITSMPGEGLPLLGIAVIVAATGFEIKDTCDMKNAMYELDIAVNPDHQILDRPVLCGMRVPTTAEVWQDIIASPGAVWDTMVNEYQDLPTMSEAWEMVRATPGQVWDLMGYLWALVPDLDPSAWLPDWDLNPFSDPEVTEVDP